MACTPWPQPEQDSQANRTWSNIVENSTRQHCSESKVIFGSQVAEDYIPLESGGNTADSLSRSGSKDGKQLKRKLPNSEKLQQNNNSHTSSSDSSFCTPWKTRDYVQDPTGLNEEIRDFLNYIKPRPEEDAVRRDVVDRVEGVIKQLWSQAKVELYGSCRTGLYLPTSDIDLVVHGKWESLPLRTLETELIEHEIADANSIRVLDKATVPIIKVTDTKTQVKIDISFNMSNGVQSADMIKSYMEQYPALPYLTFVLKQFLVNRDLNEVFSGGISSYTVVLMIVSFFQQSEHFRNTEKDVNLGVLLIEFFELYGKKFNYDHVGIRLVGTGCYFNKQQVLGTSLANETHLCIEDPLTQGNYIGKGSFRINEVKRAFEWAYSVLATGVLNHFPGNESSILGRITRIRKEANEQREKISRLLPSLSPSIHSYASYASVATRNMAAPTTTAIRSIHNTKTDLAKPEAGRTLPGSKSPQIDTNNRSEAKNKRPFPRRDSYTDAERRRGRSTSALTRDKQSSRGKSRDGRNCTETTRSPPCREKERTFKSPGSQNPPSVVTGSCGMKSKAGVKSFKYVYRKKRKTKQKRASLDI